jgi:predicted PurR-regulated permease PerM
MNEFLQMDIFFFMASVLLLIFIVVVAIAAYYLWRIFKEAKNIVEQAKKLMSEIKEEGTKTVVDFKDIRQRVSLALSKNSAIKSIIASVATAVIANTLKAVFKSKKK